MADKIVMCRRDVPSLEWDSKPCCKNIETPNIFNWCPECLKSLPFWPIVLEEEEEKKHIEHLAELACAKDDEILGL